METILDIRHREHDKLEIGSDRVKKIRKVTNEFILELECGEAIHVFERDVIRYRTKVPDDWTPTEEDEEMMVKFQKNNPKPTRNT